MSPVNSGLTAKTTGPIFTKIVHVIVALVASSIKMKPCSHPANKQRMHVVSVCLHFGQIIWLPWQRPLINLKKATDPSSARNALSYGVKIVKIGKVHPEILDQIDLFLAVSY